MNGFDSFDLEPFTMQELESRDHREQFGPGFQEVFSRLQEATLSGTFFPTFPNSHEQDPNHEQEFLQQSHYPQIQQVQSQAQTLPEPQAYYVPEPPEVIQDAVPSFLITTPRIQVSYHQNFQSVFLSSFRKVLTPCLTHIFYSYRCTGSLFWTRSV